MRGLARYVPMVALVPMLAACHLVPQFSTAKSSATPTSTEPSPSGTATATATPTPTPSTAPLGPLGVLPMPADASPWHDNKSTPLGLDAFVEAFYVTSAWPTEKGLYRQRGFVSGTLRGWINADGSQESIAIAKFKSSSGAVSQFDGLTGNLTSAPAPAKTITDPSDGGVGDSDPKLDSDGDALVDIVAHTGVYVIDVHEWTAHTPNPGAAKALLLKQYQSIKNGN